MGKTYFGEGQQPLTRAELALTEDLKVNGKGQTQADAAAGKLKFESYNSSFRFVIPNNQAGKVVLFDQTKVFTEGAIPEEWDKGVLQPGVNVAVSHIRSGFVADAVNNVGQAGVAYASQPNAWPAALRNGRYVFFQSGANPRYVQPLFTGTMAASYLPIGEGDAYELQLPMIFREQKITRIELWIPAAQQFGAPAGANLLESTLIGSWIYPRG
jgi:hypothetical protein